MTDKTEIPDLEKARAELNAVQDQQTQITGRLAAIAQERVDLSASIGEARLKNKLTGPYHQQLVNLRDEEVELIAAYQALEPIKADAQEAHEFARLISAVEDYKTTVKPIHDLVLSMADELLDLSLKAKQYMDLSRQQERASNVISRRGGEAFPVTEVQNLVININPLKEALKQYASIFGYYSLTPLEKVNDYKKLIAISNAIAANIKNL
ncbi:MAG: hypothetical protein P4L50_24655 [Anaerolineaceae bacterium]|nr:hypothetical protein [Anaerolineaceae bacterium]